MADQVLLKVRGLETRFATGQGTVHAVNGISFAGDYLSAASFLGICGMIATLGYDGFLYSIGYLAGWIVALFVHPVTDVACAHPGHQVVKAIACALL